GVAILVSEFRGDVDPASVPIGKVVGPDTHLEQLRVNGGDGFWLEGHPHLFFYHDANGNLRDESLRLAGNTLVWDQGDLTIRVEGAPTKEQAVRIATSLR